jgi:predicted nucleic acid-binding protein
MKRVFADTYFFVCLVNPKDEHLQTAREFLATFGGGVITTAWVITELANTLSKAVNRHLFLNLYADLRTDRRVSIEPPTQVLFEKGLELYAKRPDKDWSLTDCISFVVMEHEGLTEALTNDHHFEQAGFTTLLK